MTAIESLRDQFAARRAHLPGAGLPWLDALRAESLDRFAREGYPTPKVESWKFTNLRPVESTVFVPAEPAPAATLPEALSPHRLVIVGGRVREDLSSLDGLPDGVTVQPLADALATDDGWLRDRLRDRSPDLPLVALNAAFLEDGFVLRARSGALLSEPLEILFVDAADGRSVMAHPRNVVAVGAGADLTLIERHTGADGGSYLRNLVTQIEVGANARLRHYKGQFDGAQAFHLAHTVVEVGRDATYENFTLQLGARLARNEIQAKLAGTGANVVLNGAYVASGNQHIDNTTFIDHAEPHGSSREIYKGVLDDKARGVFQGKILVRQYAQKTDGHQLNRALLLSPNAEIDSKPELEIYADDVKCSHGATTGDLDAAQLFYLRARGIPEHEARALLVQAFLDEVVDEITHDGARDLFRAAARERLSRRPV